MKEKKSMVEMFFYYVSLILQIKFPFGVPVFFFTLNQHFTRERSYNNILGMIRAIVELLRGELC